YRSVNSAAGLEHDEAGFLVEQGIDVTVEYHCEVLLYEGEVLYAIPGRCAAPVLMSDGGTYGSVMLGEGLLRDSISELAVRASRALGLETGFVHCELLQARDGSFYVGELGCRPGGAMITYLLKLQHGLNVAALQASLARGERPQMAWQSRSTSVALRGVPCAAGRVETMTDPAELLAMPGVLDVVPALKVGDVTAGSVGSLVFGGFVFCEGGTPEEAERRAEATANSWRVNVVPTVSAQAAAHR
ncbi:MAG TPA: hypothetical protein VLG91_05820, partial [Streptomyces sp.]|nr:hypothetical protein [Streptomyces sp.]